MKERRNAGMRVAGKKGCRKGELYKMRDAGKRNAGKERYRKEVRQRQVL